MDSPEQRKNPTAGWLRGQKIFLLLFSGTGNASLSFLTILLEGPLFLHTVGTVFIASIYGPLWGAMTGLASALFLGIFLGFHDIPLYFALSGLLTGLIYGLMKRRGWLSSLFGVIGSIILISIITTLTGSLTTALFYKGVSHTGLDYIISALLYNGDSVTTAALKAWIPVNTFDKIITISTGTFLGHLFIRHSTLSTPSSR